ETRQRLCEAGPWFGEARRQRRCEATGCQATDPTDSTAWRRRQRRQRRQRQRLATLTERATRDAARGRRRTLVVARRRRTTAKIWVYARQMMRVLLVVSGLALAQAAMAGPNGYRCATGLPVTGVRCKC